MTPEQKLLSAFLKKHNDSEIEWLLQTDIDWKLFFRLARKNRLNPFIYQKSLNYSALIPTEILNILQNRAERNSKKSLEMNSQLLKLSRIFSENKVEFIAYKGATLSQIAYKSTSQRQFSDLDFFIFKQDFPKVKKIILENGGKPAWNLLEKEEKAVLKYYYEYPFLFGDKSVLVEIHWSFIESFFTFDFEPKGVFERQRKVGIHGKQIPTLSNEDLLIVLCVHGSKHLWNRLSWICDVGQLVNNQPISWEQVIKLAQQYGCLRMLNLGLLLAKEVCGTELPTQILSKIEADKELDSLLQNIKHKIFDQDTTGKELDPRIHRKMRERWRDKFTYSHRLFTTKLVDSLFMPMGRPR